MNNDIQDGNIDFFRENFSRAMDVVKGLAIILVVLGHINSPLGSVIYSFHIPLFFVIGGVFINIDNTISLYLRKNLLRIIVPYFLFGFIGLAVNSGKEILLLRPRDNLFDELIGLFLWMDIDHLQHYGFVLWFLPALFWARLIIFVVEKYLAINLFATLFLFLFLSLFLSNSIILPLAIDKGLLVLPWVFSGYIFNRYKHLLLSYSLWKAVIAFITVILLAYLTGMLPLDMARKNIGSILLSFPYTLSIGYLIVFLAHNAKRQPKWLILIGQSTMLILVFHPYVNNFSHLLVNRFSGNEWYFKLFISLLILSCSMAIKIRYPKNLMFRFL